MDKAARLHKIAICAGGALFAWTLGAAETIPAFLFGQNIEHTRSAVQGGLSAQLVRNRKFAGKPARNGVCAFWNAYGARAFYDRLDTGVTRHAAKSAMFRQNELGSQLVECLEPNGEAGIRQDRLGFRGGVSHTVRAVVRTFNVEGVVFVLRLRDGERVLAEQRFDVRSANDADWKRISFDWTATSNVMASLDVGVVGRHVGVLGAVSILPADSFHGMRADVVENLREIGTSIIRWPGGNFAGEYRWRDGLIADPDERAPLQSYTEIETQPHSLGYDSNDIGMEDILALCQKIGAEPYFTINAVWETPEDSAEWVSRCKGRVRTWSLGNEMGYRHMEGPQGPADYVKMVRPHAEAMRRADSSIRLIASGRFPWGGEPWITQGAVPLADIAPIISYHHYAQPGVLDFSTPARTAALYARTAGQVDHVFTVLSDFRRKLPSNIALSFDEWNLWYAWYHVDGIVEGLFAARFLNRLMREWRQYDLADVCYFQAVNEHAIDVGPFASRLTSIGEAMRLAKGHVGGVPVEIPSLPVEAFVTDASDGTRYMTFHNFSTTETRMFRIPLNGRHRLIAAETLVPDGLEAGCRYVRSLGQGRIVDDVYHLALPPACQASARLAR